MLKLTKFGTMILYCELIHKKSCYKCPFEKCIEEEINYKETKQKIYQQLKETIATYYN